ncbi:MAG TPA: HEAT repeat domain-containing protein [Pirellulales bacterium]|nr:HEAT repeat domain-containing protein [Pirellulales bacterium]
MVGLALILTISTGCTSTPDWALFKNHSKKDKLEPGPQVTAPVERIKQMHELAKRAHEMSPQEQEKESVELARAIQHEEDPLIRQQILRTLAVFSTPLSTTVLTAGAKDTDPNVRIACCEAWGKKKGPDSVKVLTEVLNSDTDLDVRMAATRGLGESGEPAAIESLGVALDDKDPAMQHCAIVSLEKISGKRFPDVSTWRTYVRGGSPEEESVVARMKRWF